VALPNVAAPTPVAKAEALAAAALELAKSDPQGALRKAREALAETSEFEPTTFVDAGRKGEVVEDEFVAARQAYRRHRAGLYAAVGVSLAAAGDDLGATRYLRRARLLDPSGAGASLPLARSLVALGRGFEALDALEIGSSRALNGAAREVAEAAADAVRLPSLQAEIDRRRLLALDVDPAVEFVTGRFELERGSRLSTGAPLRLDQDGIVLFYVADRSCRSCSADLEAIDKIAGDDVRVVMAPSEPDEDHAIRQTVQVYRYSWPFLVRSNFVRDHQIATSSAFLVARRGWVGATVRPPFQRTLRAALDALRIEDVVEMVPRARWSHRLPVPTSAHQAPEALPEGLLPGEDAPFPAGFDAALAAYREKRFAEAMRAFEALDARGDGWLLPPEANVNRALCLAGQGQRNSARQILLRIGDSRDQNLVDQLLERVGTPQ
jgi:hypothetical protein